MSSVDDQEPWLIPYYQWKGRVINASRDFLEETGLSEMQVNAWYARGNDDFVFVDHGTRVQSCDKYFIQSGGQYMFESIRVWIPSNTGLMEPALERFARCLYPDADQVYIKKQSIPSVSDNQ